MPRLAALLFSLFALAACGGEDAAVPPTPPAPPIVEPVELAEVLPSALLGRDRQSLDTSSEAALGAQVTRATAGYGPVTVAVTDFQTAEMTKMMGRAGLAASPDQFLGHPVQRERSVQSASTTVLVDGRALVQVTAPTGALADSALSALDLAALRR